MPDLRRSEAQNRKWRALLTDVSRCKPEGRELTPDAWSILLFAAWDHDRRFGDLQLMEGLEGRPPVPVNGYSTSLLTVAEMADLITFAIEYAERHGVRWSGGEHDIAADPVMQQHGRTVRAIADEQLEALEAKLPITTGLRAKPMPVHGPPGTFVRDALRKVSRDPLLRRGRSR